MGAFNVVEEMELSTLEKALKVRSFYNSLSIGHNGAQDCNWFVGPEPFRLSARDHSILVQQGEAFRAWFEITLDLCTKAYRYPNLKWLADLVEGESPEHVKDVHRRAHLSGMLCVPTFARPDMSSIGASVEVQIPGSGWGYQAAIQNAALDNSAWPGLVAGLKNAVRVLTGSSQAKAAYVLYNQPFLSEVEYFCKLCEEAGVQLQMHFQSLPSPTEVEFLRRPPLEDLLSYEGGPELIKAWFDEQLVLEPGPSLLFDQKLPILFPFHPLLREYYPDSVRQLFPETHLVERNGYATFDGQVVGWKDFTKKVGSNYVLPQRQYILKYAGAKKGMRAGGKAVYNLSDYSRTQVEELLEMACRDWEEKKSPWLIQKRIQQKYAISYLDHETGQIREAPHYALFRPMYSFLSEQPVTIVSCIGVFRKDWKVHGSSDSVLLQVEP